jgi:hypothetical protein
LLAPLDYQPSPVCFFELLLLMPEESEQRSLVSRQAVLEIFIDNARRSVNQQSVIDHSEPYITAAQIVEQSWGVHISNSTRSFLEGSCD